MGNRWRNSEVDDGDPATTGDRDGLRRSYPRGRGPNVAPPRADDHRRNAAAGSMSVGSWIQPS